MRKPTIPTAVLERIKFAGPPPSLPRGYFDNFITPTRKLMDQGMRLMQAADWLIQQGVLKQRMRRKFAEAMRSRLTRLHQQEITSGANLKWQAAWQEECQHIVPKGKTTAVCGVRRHLWLEPSESFDRCTVCQGIVTQANVTINRS